MLGVFSLRRSAPNVLRPQSDEFYIAALSMVVSHGDVAADTSSPLFISFDGNRISRGPFGIYMHVPSRKHHSRASHLAGRDDLQRTKGDLEVGSVGLEVVQSLSNVLLKLGGVLPRGAVGGDLVQGLGAHLD